jgi:hypothetical protein
MPPWCDVTLYDVAAQNLLGGGIHYRDVFDTNMPGFPWALAGVRAVLGWSTEAVRAVDLLVVGGIAWLLERLATRGGADRAARAWLLAGIAVFYPFTSEFNHCQRDVWMLLPALAAVAIRGVRLGQPTALPRPSVLGGLVEGALWGLACWVKPHVIVPAAVVWLLTAPRLIRIGSARSLAGDLAGNLLGGVFVGALGVGVLVGTGTWPHFVEVFTFWNTGYASLMWEELPVRFDVQLHYFPPWSYLQVVAVPVALLCVLDGRPRPGVGPVGRRLPAWLWDTGSDDRVRFARLVLAAVYLGWVGQAFFLQRDFHYVHVPETLMMLAVLATHRWKAGLVCTAWLAASSLLVGLGLFSSQNPPPVRTFARLDWGVLFVHPAADPARWPLWWDCWRGDLTEVEYYRRRNAVALVKDFHGSNDWEQLAEVADELRRRGAGDRDVVCWHDAPHAVYLLLGVRPGFRFLHVSQMIGVGPAQQDRVRAELSAAAPHVRWVVSDLWRAGADVPESLGDPTSTGPDLLPLGMIPEVRDEFPFDQPAVFRSGGGRGRYILHELKHPITWHWEPGRTDAAK